MLPPGPKETPSALCFFLCGVWHKMHSFVSYFGGNLGARRTAGPLTILLVWQVLQSPERLFSPQWVTCISCHPL